MRKFEYMTVKRNDDVDSVEFKEWLNKVGREGWEVVNVQEDTAFFTLTTVVLKRELE